MNRKPEDQKYKYQKAPKKWIVPFVPNIWAKYNLVNFGALIGKVTWITLEKWPELLYIEDIIILPNISNKFEGLALKVL